MDNICSPADDSGISGNTGTQEQVWTLLMSLIKWLCVNLTDQSERERTERDLKGDTADLSVARSGAQSFPEKRGG